MSWEVDHRPRACDGRRPQPCTAVCALLSRFPGRSPPSSSHSNASLDVVLSLIMTALDMEERLPLSTDMSAQN